MIIVIGIIGSFTLILSSGFVLLHLSNKRNSTDLEWIGAIFMLLALALFIASFIVSIYYYKAGIDAETINKMFRTNYTRDELFFSKSIIMNTIEGKKYKIILDDKDERLKKESKLK